MNYRVHKKTWILVFHIFLICFLRYDYVLAQPATSYLESLKEKFIAYVTTDIQAYQVLEIVDPNDDKKAFLRKTFKGKYRPGNETVHYKELFIDDSNKPGQWHLGAITLAFRSERQADKLFSKIKTSREPSYFYFSVILMRYVVLKHGATIIVVYSETGDAPKMATFFTTLSNP